MQSRADSYRELAMQAINDVAEYKTRAEHQTERGYPQIATEYLQLASEATVRAEKYLILADFAERNSLEATKQPATNQPNDCPDHCQPLPGDSQVR